MPHLAPLNWSYIFILANLQLFLVFIPLWWKTYPSYTIPKLSLKIKPFHLFSPNSPRQLALRAKRRLKSSPKPSLSLPNMNTNSQNLTTQPLPTTMTSPLPQVPTKNPKTPKSPTNPKKRRTPKS